MKSNRIFVLAAAFAVTSTFALGQQIACPNGLKYVQTGISVAQFTKACGMPQHELHPKLNYTIYLYKNGLQVQHVGFAKQHRLVKPASVAIVAHNGSVGAIRYMDEKNTAAKFLCTDPVTKQAVAVQKGEAISKVKAACGKPDQVEHLNQLDKNTHNNLIQMATYLQYQEQSYLPVVTYVFEGDKLIGRSQQHGQLGKVAQQA